MDFCVQLSVAAIWQKLLFVCKYLNWNDYWRIPSAEQKFKDLVQQGLFAYEILVYYGSF